MKIIDAPFAMRGGWCSNINLNISKKPSCAECWGGVGGLGCLPIVLIIRGFPVSHPLFIPCSVSLPICGHCHFLSRLVVPPSRPPIPVLLLRGDTGNPWVNFGVPAPVPMNTAPVRLRVRCFPRFRGVYPNPTRTSRVARVSNKYILLYI